MKRFSSFIIFFFIGIGTICAQNVALPLRDDVHKVKLRFKKHGRKNVKGILYNLTDSTVVLTDTYNRELFLEDELRLTTYSFSELKRFKHKSHKHGFKKIGTTFGLGFLVGYFTGPYSNYRPVIGLAGGLYSLMWVSSFQGYSPFRIKNGKFNARRAEKLKAHSILYAPTFRGQKRPFRVGLDFDLFKDIAQINLDDFVGSLGRGRGRDTVDFIGKSYAVGGSLQVPIFKKNNYFSFGLKYYNRSFSIDLKGEPEVGRLDITEVVLPIQLWLYNTERNGFQVMLKFNYERSLFLKYKNSTSFPSVLSTGSTLIPKSDHLDIGVGFQFALSKSNHFYFLVKAINNDKPWRFRYLFKHVHLVSSGLEFGYLHDISRK